MRYSARVAPDYGYLVTYLRGQMTKLKVDVHLNTKVDLSAVSEFGPDAVVVATGEPTRESIFGR